MKITVKRTLAVVTAVVLSLAFGIAYADDAFNLYVSPGISIGQGSAAGGVRYDDHSIDQVLFADTKDTGTELHAEYLDHKAELAKGSAAGGVRVKEIDPDFASPSWDSMPTMFPQR